VIISICLKTEDYFTLKLPTPDQAEFARTLRRLNTFVLQQE